MKKVAEVVMPVSYPRNEVFAAAIAAQRINGEYVKRAFTPYVPYRRGRTYYAPVNRTQTDVSICNKPYNAYLMKSILESNKSDILPEDYEQGEVIRSYFCSKITAIFDGTAQDFLKGAIEASIADEISSTQQFGLIASLPSVYERNIKRSNDRAILSDISSNSVPLTSVIGDYVKLNVTVLDSIYKEKYNSHAVNVKVNNVSENHVLFFFGKDTYQKGSSYNISGRIKSKGNQITQLHYVKKID